jgi:hypothetical protein
MLGFVYAQSAFTHLPEEVEMAWMNESTRALRSGGLLLITTHGEGYLHELEPEEQERFRSGQVVVERESAAGANACNAYHPEQYVRNH